MQISNSSNINRYDRLTETSKALPVYSEWYYGPQIRNLISYKYTATKLPGYFSDLMVTSSFQDIEESRYDRRFNNNNRNDQVHLPSLRQRMWRLGADRPRPSQQPLRKH